MPGFTYAMLQEGADTVRRHLGDFQPELGIILGSGLGPLTGELQQSQRLPYREIPHFLLSTAPDHAGELVWGTLAGRNVICLSGRFHYYEGYDYEQLVAPIRLLYLLGVKAALLTNACGAINPAYQPGDVVVLKDHIKLTGASPLRGPNAEEFGPRFFDMTTAYTPGLRQLALSCSKGLSLRVHEGVYAFMGGPQFETPAEIRALGILGADVVGMSTVTEVITAAHCGLPVLALALVTNTAAGVDHPCSAEEVNQTAQNSAPVFCEYVRRIVAGMER